MPKRSIYVLLSAVALTVVGSFTMKILENSAAAEHTGTKAAVKPSEPDAAEKTSSPTTKSPVQAQAEKAGVKSCLPQIKNVSGAIRSEYAVFSSWSQAAPNDHIFQSYLSMQQTDPMNRAFGLLTVAPTTSGCDSTTLQVAPVTKSCDDIQAEATKSGHPLLAFNGLWTTATNGALRQILVPAGPNACVVVTTGMTFDLLK